MNAFVQASRESDDAGGQFYFELSDQNGNRVQLPPNERKSLVMGLSLHDNGRKKLQEGDVPDALDILLAADKCLSEVSTDVLSSTDNYGLLCLDVAWCYFLTQNLDFLTDAAWRLQKAAECFEKSYGKNQERLIALKGAAAPEMIIFVRLDLLNMVVAYHQANFASAKTFFSMAQDRMSTMYIQDEDTIPLIAMGFHPRDCRMALQACKKNFDQAAQWLLEKKEHRRQKREEERLTRARERQERKYGKTRNGSWVQVEAVTNFVAMGFEEALAAEALRQSDNSKDQALNALLNQSEVLRLAAQQNFQAAERQILELEAMGFTRKRAIDALKQSLGVLADAVGLLAAFADLPDDTTTPTLNVPAETSLGALEAVRDGAPSLVPLLGDMMDDGPPKPVGPSETEAQRRERELQEEAEQEVINNMGDEDTHLDLNLEREMSVLQLYESLLRGK